MSAPRSLLKGFEKVVETVRPDPKKRLVIYDEATTGLCLIVSPKGRKTFTIVSRRPDGKQVWKEVAKPGEMDLAAVRAKARHGVQRIKQGLEPFPAAAPKKAPETFKQVSNTFLARYVRKEDKEGRPGRDALRTADEIERHFKVYVWPRWNKKDGERAFLSIRRGDISRLLDEIEDANGSVQADRVLATLSKLFNWYASREDDYLTPIARGMNRTKSRDRARKRILSDQELRTVWNATNGTFGAFVKICLLTAQRRAKVANMRWDDIAEDGTWTIPAEEREKVNAGELRLPEMALDIINSLPRVEGNPFVFAGRSKKAIAGFSKGKSELDKAAPMPAWVLHDLRRTAKSLMARAGVRPDISERVLGHVIEGVEGVYDRYSYISEKADALAKLAGLLTLIINPPTGNVTRLEQAAAS